MKSEQMNAKAMRLATWTGPVLTVLFFIGLIPMMKFVPPPHPTDSAAEIKSFYLGNLDGIRIGSFFLMMGVGLIAPYGVSIAVWTRRTEGKFPVLTYIQLTCIAVGTMVGVLIALMWGAAAFRPDDTSADITRLLNDLGWFFFLFDWPPFVIWFVAVALGIFWDKSPEPALPRWSGYLSLWVGILSIPAGLMLFFKRGPFGYNGFITMYIPLTVFFVWIVIMTVLLLKAIAREERRAAQVPEAATTDERTSYEAPAVAGAG